MKEFQPESVLLGQNGRPAKCLSSPMPTFRLEQGQQYVLHLCLRRYLADGKNWFPSMVMLFILAGSFMSNKLYGGASYLQNSWKDPP